MNTILARTVALVAAGVFALAGCADTEASVTPTRTTTDASETPNPTPTPSGEEETFLPFPAGAVIGVALPDSTERWTRVGSRFEAELAAAGFTPDVRYTADNFATSEQQEQILDMVDEGAKVIIVSAVDGTQLGPQLEAAKAAGVTVIAFDRLVYDTEAVDFYISYDMHIVGQLQAKALLRGLEERAPSQSQYTIELFSGSPDDPAADWFFDGAMSVLEPKIDDGTLVVVSDQTDRGETSTENWNSEYSGVRMENLLSSYYRSTTLDGVLAPNDGVALSVIEACHAFGAPIPVVTGQDSMADSVVSIMKGEQYMTLDKSMLPLVDHSVEMVQDLQKGTSPEVNDSHTYDNRAKTVRAYLLSPVTVTKENAAEVYKDNPDLYPLTQP
jgi:putative multiple sugar transport system substrate-binding protein